MVVLHVAAFRNSIYFDMKLVANILPADHHPRGQRSKFIFLEKWNYECSNLVANILPQTSPDLGLCSIGQSSHVSEHGYVAFHI